ncbi:MAG: hypothetical protein ABS917_11245 [Solibacillus sp.]|uniref:hypothetical protein n=1 Tax=Solibacillus sp. TaxID=1909654 RepID=UPI003315EF97
MAEKLKGKFVLIVTGEVEPLFATEEQWIEMSGYLKEGEVPVTTNKGVRDVFGVLEVAKGWQGTGLASAECITMIFSMEN